MSQYFVLNEGSVIPYLQTLTGDTGGAVGPNASHNIFITAGPGVFTLGTPGTNTLEIGRAAFVTGTVTTTNATPTTVLSFDMGSIAGVYTIRGSVSAFDKTDVAGASFFYTAGCRTTGAAGTLISVNMVADSKEVAMTNSTYSVTVTSNHIVIAVTGLLSKTIDWTAEFEYNLVI